MRLLFFIILFGVGYLLYHLYGKKLLKQGKAGLIKPALILLGVLLILAVLTGRANAIFAIIGGLLASAFRLAPLVFRFYPQIRELLHKFGFKGFADQRGSRVTTTTLSMTLNHQSGQVDGEITGGEFQGQRLSSLTLDEVKTYYNFCSTQDPQALRLIEVFVHHQHPDQREDNYWNKSRQYDGGSSSGNNPTMSAEEALDILGLNTGASKQEITYAHRKLMSKLHPDKGGSTYLATRVNQAKDLLIDQLSD